MKPIEPQHDKTNKLTCAPSKDSGQPGHPSSLIRDFTVLMKKSWVISYPWSAQWRLSSDWADAQADLSLHWAHRSFCWFCRAAVRIIVIYHVAPNLQGNLRKEVLLTLKYKLQISSQVQFRHWLHTRNVSKVHGFPLPHALSTVNFLNIRTPKIFVVITLKCELCGSTIE